MSESLRNDGRVWVPEAAGRHPRAGRDPRGGARLLPGAEVPELRQPGPARHRRRAPPRKSATKAGASGPAGCGVYLDFADAITRLGEDTIRERYGNLFEMYQRITDEDPYKVPMRIYPAVHYTMGGLWVDYNLMSTIPGLLRDRRGELLRSRRQPARRQRADAGAGRRLLRAAVHHRELPRHAQARARWTPTIPRPARWSRRSTSGCGGCWPSRARAPWTPSTASSASCMWEHCGMARNADGLRTALARIPELAGRVLAEREGARHRRGAEPVAREGRARGGLHGVRRADVPRRAAARGVLRRPLPHGVPDRGRRGEARRRAVRLRGRLGVHRRRHRAPSATTSRSTFENVQLATRSYK